MGEEKTRTELKGLYLAPPHGELIARGEKTVIAKSRFVPGDKMLDLRGDWILVSKIDKRGLGLGDMTLGEPVEVSLKDFDAQFERHRVSEAERWRWWPNREKLWLYPVTEFTPYESVKSVTVPAGVQTMMGDVTFDTQTRSDEADKAYSGVAIALAVPASVAEKLAVEGAVYEGGEGQGVIPPDMLHLTLAYLGKAEELQEKQELLQESISAFAAQNKGILGKIDGRIVFNTPNGSAVCAHFDSPDLSGFRQKLIDFLANLGFEPAGDHGFTPHICLAYTGPGNEAEIDTPTVSDVSLDKLSVLWAGDQTDYQLGGTESKGIAATQFTLAHRAWEDETIAAEVWDLFIGDDDRNYWHVALAGDPITESNIAAQPASGATVTDTDGNTHSVFGLAVGDQIAVKPGSKFNPAETPCKFEVLDTGAAQTLLDEESQREYSFDGDEFKGTWRLQIEDESKPEGFWIMSKSEQPEAPEAQPEAPEAPETEEANMPWTVSEPPNPAKNWTEAEKEKCVEAANAVIEGGGEDQDAIFACIRAAGKTEHPGGEKENTMQEITVLIDGEQTEEVKAKWSASYISSLPDTAFLIVEKGGEKKDGITRPLSLRHLPVRGKDGEVDLPHLRNAIARAPQLKDKDGEPFSKAAIEKAQDKARKLLAESQKADDARLADDGANYCICPTCKRVGEHERGEPCNEVKCEECDAMMQKATEAEIEAAGAQAEQAEVTAAATTVDASVKAGRRVRRDKVDMLQKLRKEFEDFLSAFKEFFGWATYEDVDVGAKEGSVGFDLSAWLSDEGKKSLIKYGSAAFALKALDGTPWWMQWTMNSFEDREHEIFTTKAIDDFVESHRDKEIKGEFWYRHIPGTKFGDVRWQAMEGRFLVQAGPFDTTPIGTAFKEFFGQYPTGHPAIAPEGWGTSHKYSYDPQDREDGIYDWFEIKESTVLPLSAASNPWNPMPQLLEVKQMNDQEKSDLEAIGGKDLVRDVLEAGQAKTKELEEAGVAYKEAPAQGEDEKAGDMAKLIGKVEKIAGGMEGEEAEALKAICADMKEAYADMEAGPEPGEKEAEVEPEPEPVKEAPLTREEVGAGMKALLTAVREEIKATSEATVQTLVDQLKPIIEELAAEPDPEPEPEPEAVKESLTPAASLADMFASVRASKEAQISPDSALAQKGPKEIAPTAPAVTGVTLVDQFIAGTDQVGR